MKQSVTLALLFLATFGLPGCQKKPPSTEQTPSALVSTTRSTGDHIVIPVDSPKMQHIQVQTVVLAPVPTAEITAPGKIEANPNLISHVNLSAPGRISSVLVHLGDRVTRGQPLLTVSSSEASTAVSTYRETEATVRDKEAELREAHGKVLEARIGVSKAKTSLSQAEADFRRVSDLFRHDAIARKEVLSAQTALRQAEADVESNQQLVAQALAYEEGAGAGIESARAALQQAGARLGLLGIDPADVNPEVTVRSPLTGKVLDISVVAGEFQNSLDDPVMTIADLSSVYVTSNVPESSIRFIDVGDPVFITLDAFPGDTFPGRVARLADTLDPKTRTVKVVTELRNEAGKFRPEMFGRIHHVHKVRSLPVIPVTAVLQVPDGNSAVFVESSPGTYDRHPVRIGQRVGEKVPVLDGVHPGDRVVVDGAVLLR